MAAVRHVEFAKIAVPLWSRDLYMHVFLHLQSTFLLIGQYGAEIQPKTIFNMASVRHLEFAKFRLLCQITILGMDIVICVLNLIENG